MREIHEYIEDVANDMMTAQDAADEILEITLGDIGKKIKDVVTAPVRAVQYVAKAAKGPNPKYKVKGRPISYMKQRLEKGMNPLDVRS